MYLVQAEGDQNLSLTVARTEVSIYNSVASTTISHSYKNQSKVDLETQFSFPVNRSMAISSLQIICDGV